MGRPIIISKFNTRQLRRFYEQHSVDRLIDMYVMFYERVERIVLPMCSKKAGKLVGEWTRR